MSDRGAARYEARRGTHGHCSSDPIRSQQLGFGSSLLGLYIHIPFCSVKCFYCDFTAFSGARAQISRYIKALAAEARLRPRQVVRTLYVGGGTPSELSAEELGELLRIVDASYGPVSGMTESTVETSPETLTSGKLEVLSREKVGRISLGLQTAHPRLLKEIGRRHSVEDFRELFGIARKLRFSINVDLMYGLPSQTVEEALWSLDFVLALEPEHVSLYGLQVEDRTLFAKRKVREDEDLGREMYEKSLDRIAAAGYHHYEISNFSLPGKESIHNQIYWRNGEYVGLGCGAGGHLDGIRYANKDRLKDYCETVERGEVPSAESECLSGREKMGETILLGLRMMEGVTLTPDARNIFSEELRYLNEQGLIESAGDRIRLTRKGGFLANRVFEEFVPPFRSDAPSPANASPTS